jgi:hypothetical protein
MPVGQHLRLRCFLEGIEVPVISASLAIQANSPAQCQIQIPATDKAHELLPRTLVHLFFRDYYDGPGDHIDVGLGATQAETASEQVAQEQQQEQVSEARTEAVVSETAGTEPEITESGAAVRRITFEDDDVVTANPSDQTVQADTGDGAAGPTMASESEGEAEDQDRDKEDRRWKLFFVGEVIGYQFVKSSMSRSIILHCLDPSVYWDTCYQYKVNSSSLTGDGMANFVGAGTDLFDEFYEGSESILLRILNQNSRSRPDLTGLLSGVVHLLERVGGVYRGQGFRGVNDFFSLAELRLHLVDMITASERDDTSRRMAPRMAYNRFMRRAGGSLGQISSFREILNMINSFIFHDVYACPIAKFDSPEEATRTRSRSTSREVRNTPRGRDFWERFTSLYMTGRRTTLRRREYSGPQWRWVGSEEIEQQNPEWNALRQGFESVRTGAQSLSPQARGLGMHDVASNLQQVSSFADRAWRNWDRWCSDQMFEKLEDCRAAMLGATITSRSQYQESYTTTWRLNSQILRPDIWMVSPPRCNVLFPELYGSIDYSRQYMQEVSRMRLTVTDEIFGSDELLNQCYYAPDVEVLGERQQQVRGGSGTLRQEAYNRRLMDHELYTGVVPVFERMNEVNIYAARTDPVAERGARVPYVVRAAHFQYFKHRFTPRTISVSGKFNPYAVAGFPAVIIDKYMTSSQLAASNLRELDLYLSLTSQRDQLDAHEREGLQELDSAEISELQRLGGEGANLSSLTSTDDIWLALRLASPTQFVGMIVGLNHTITQNSANTSYSIQYGRTHRENDELLGANRQTVGRADAGTATRTTTVAAPLEDPPRVGQLGPWFGNITRVTQVDRTGNFLLYGTFLPQSVRQRGRQTSREIQVPVGVRQPALSYSAAEVTRIAGGERVEIEFTAFEIEEEIERIRGDVVDIPFEDFVRPPWFSDVWKNDRIGAIYQQFFGTGALTDDLMVYTGSNSSVSSSETDAEPAVRQADAQARREHDPTDWQLEDGGTVQESEMKVNVERSIDLLVRAYSEVKQEGFDVQEFIRAYCWRPIADMIQMLGSRDLVINPETGVVQTGTKGFHSLAFGHGPMGQNIRNLLPDANARQILGIGTGEGQDRANLISRLDKRADKAARVRDYVQELWSDRGQLG